MISPSKLNTFADEGFYQTIEPSTARRQFNMSLGLVAMLSMVALTLGLSAGFAPIEQSALVNSQARLVVQSPQRVHVMQAQATQIPGG